MTNIYWPVYKNLESEIEKLMFSIHIDDNQLKVYSSKISDMILRAATEIESISKDLYQKNGGPKTDRIKIKYDHDAIDFLKDEWLLSKKIVIISHHNFHGTEKVLKPFEENEKRTDNISTISDSGGRRAFGWNNAYQNLKHDRTKSLEFGSIKYLFEIMAALYILNIYYKDESFDLNGNKHCANFNEKFISSIFSIETFWMHSYKVYKTHTIRFTPFNEVDMERYEESIFVQVPDMKDIKNSVSFFREKKILSAKNYSNKIFNEKLSALGKKYKRKETFETVLNKNQF